MDIKTDDDFAEALDLIMQLVAKSDYLATIDRGGMVLRPKEDEDRADSLLGAMYGIEIVSAVESRGRAPGYKYAIGMGYPKNIIIESLVDFALDENASLTLVQQRNMIDAMREAGEQAIVAVARREDGSVVNDPRHRTCEAVARGFVRIARSALPEVTKGLAVQALVALGDKAHVFKAENEHGHECTRIIEGELLQAVSDVAESSFANACRVVAETPTNTNFHAMAALQVASILRTSLYGDIDQGQKDTFMDDLQKRFPTSDRGRIAGRFIEAKVGCLINNTDILRAERMCTSLEHYIIGMIQGDGARRELFELTVGHIDEMKESGAERNLGGLKKTRTVIDAALARMRATIDPAPAVPGALGGAPADTPDAPK